jgi:hypothetical protein
MDQAHKTDIILLNNLKAFDKVQHHDAMHTLMWAAHNRVSGTRLDLLLDFLIFQTAHPHPLN